MCWDLHGMVEIDNFAKKESKLTIQWNGTCTQETLMLALSIISRVFSNRQGCRDPLHIDFVLSRMLCYACCSQIEYKIV